MNISYKWLQQFTPVDVDEKTFVHQMCMTGTEVTGYTKPSDEIRNVVVGKILSVKPHENADKLVVCSVDVGMEEPVQIVTGAKNVFEGALVPVAKDGADLPGGTHIKKGKLRGVESCGMMCSVSELGITAADYPDAIEDGILILKDGVPGTDVCKVLGLDDCVFVADIATNRSDCLSMIGIAREAAATFQKPLHLETPQVQGNGADIHDYLQVEIQDRDLCQRYSARVVTDIQIGPSPSWMVERLRANGIRSINNIVDITNYVMLEYGQPMHAFDYECITGGKIVVRRAQNGEQVVTLDGKQHTCTDNILVIADACRAVGLAGIMGGENSEIKPDTKTVVFESANFDGTTIRRGAKQLGMRTDASSLFEKRLDPGQTMQALDRACQLVEMLGAGKVSKNSIDLDYSNKEQKKIALEADWINRHLGIEATAEQMKQILLQLGFGIQDDTVLVPSFRMDIENKYDLSEEVARFYGYDRIPSESFKGLVEPEGLTAEQQFERKVGVLFRSCGFSEAMTFSFISPKVYDKLLLAQDSELRNFLKIQNPLGEDTSVMRTTAVPSMLEVLARNFSYRAENVALYEMATVYLKQEDEKELPREPKIITAGLYGKQADFFSVKGQVDAVLSELHIRNISYKAPQTPPSYYHPGRCAEVYSGNRLLGILGQVHPTVQKNYEIDVPVYLIELPLQALYQYHSAKTEYKPIPKYPAVNRDLALVCAEEIYSGDIEAKIKKYAGKELESIRVFDVYRGSQVGDGKKSIAYSLSLRSADHTLADEEIDSIMTQILTGLEKDDIQLRK